MSKKKMFLRYLLISIISSLVLTVIGIFSTFSIPLIILHLFFLNALLSGSIYDAVYIQSYNQRKRQLSFALYLIFAIAYIIYFYNQSAISQGTYITMLLVNIVQLVKYFN